MPPKPDGRLALQGWALVDNTQDQDWQNVELALIAGLPVSFVHDLYNARYRRRPVVEIEEDIAYGPPSVENALEDRFDLGDAGVSAELAMAAAPAGGIILPDSARERHLARSKSVQPEVQKRTIEAGDLYAYTIKNPVTVKRGQSALVPILAEQLSGKRIAFYNAEIREKNPMAALRFTNDTGMTLEGGPVTVIEGDDYVGEAMLDTAKDGEERILPYAVELGCVIAQDHESQEQDVYQVVIKDGTLSLYYARLARTIYLLNNRCQRDLDLYLEHRYRKQWELVDSSEPVARTEHFYRFRIDLPAHKQQKFVVCEKGLHVRTYHLTDIDRGQLVVFLANGYLDQDTEKRVQELIEIQEQIASVQGAINSGQQRRESIFKNQQRLRENLQVLGERQQEQELRQRYINLLTEEEDCLSKLDSEIDSLGTSLHQHQKLLDEKVKTLRYRVDVDKSANQAGQ